ncbi:MAG: ABC transporter ATP-binding protein [Lachnospiraceae bacterium]|nr:ABC transporter ATP-binding protein [Lachnospiraceae bacterium]
MSVLKKVMVLLDKKQKRTMIGLIFIMLIGAILEAASITVIFPAIQAIIEPEAVESGITGSIYRFLGMKSVDQFIVVVLIGMIVAFILKNVFLFFQMKALFRFIYSNQFRTSERMMKNFLSKDYEFYLNADTAVIQRSITSDVNNMYAYILALLQIASEAIVFVTLTTVLLISDFVMTLVIAVVMVLTLYLIKIVIKPIMKKSGKENQDFYSGLFKWISQTVIGIKEVKIGGKENYFIDEYLKCGYGYVNAVQKYSLYNNTPRLLIETICIICMVGYLAAVVIAGGDVATLTPIISVFALAAMRLMPCANRINNQLTNLAYFEPFVLGISDNLQDEINNPDYVKEFSSKEVKKLPVEKEIVLKDITYAYPNTEVLIFNKANMTIPVGSAVGIVGSSGAGKTTIVDILLGLLNLRDGKILADGVDVQTQYYGWLKNIGYIPQMIFMLDDTIRKNVAFGIPEEEIDDERVMQALKEAQLDEFVKGLPDGLDTTIGERGIRLSGGQRQRIGIARALYEDPEILILDEATSALDNDTEAAIMESINHFQGKKTLVIIAHRLQTIEKCDMVFRVENAQILRER